MAQKRNRLIALAFFALCLIGSDARAQQSFEAIVSGANTRFLDILGDDYVDTYDDSYKDRDPGKQRSYIYDEVTMENLSKLYWGIGYLDIENDLYIDNYMKINECSIYQTYSATEFEWNEIRAATRNFIKRNKDDFSKRFQFVQPLKLDEYDSKRRAFYIDPKFQFKSTRRFEVMAKDAYAAFCTGHTMVHMQGFNRGILLEFSSPFSLEYLPATTEVAEKYLADITKIFKSYQQQYQTQENFRELRKAYILFKVKIFSSGGAENDDSLKLTRMLGALEGYEVYSDAQLKNLLYSKSYITRTDSSKQNARLQKEYDILRDRSANGGILTNI